MLKLSREAKESSAPAWYSRVHGALMPDYNVRAASYWWVMVLLGVAILGVVGAAIARMPWPQQLQILIGCAIAMLAAMFPVRIPGSNNSFVAGEVFIILLLLMHGPSAATLAAAGEAFVGAWRSSKRWTSRLVSPATAAISMSLLGSALATGMDAMRTDTVFGETMVVLLAMSCALCHFVLNALLVALIPHLKRRERLRLRSFFASFGWVGTTYAASALIAGLLFLAFKATGIGVMAGAVPIIVALLVMLHYHFRQRESDMREQARRIEAAEREAERAARHLLDLRESEQRFHSAFSHAAIGMMLVTTEGQVLQANAAMTHLLACAENELVGRHFGHFVHPEDLGLLTKLWQAEPGRDMAAGAVELRCLRRDADTVFVAMHSARFCDREASASCLILQAQDITARRRAEDQLQHIAYHDSLTSLANRIRFGTCLEQAIARCKRDPAYQFAVMYLDFDRFKLINDTLGHNAGDRFLTMVAQRIVNQVRPSDIVGRLGGDEFAILVDSQPDEAGTLAMAERLLGALARPYEVDGTEVNSSASIGITFSTVGYATPGDVLRDADIAMYRAKSAGRARVALFDSGLRAQLATQVRLERDLRRAIEGGELGLSFQPIFDLVSGEIHAFEALVRWTHPELGPIAPATFLPIAEDSAQLAGLTQWVLGEACAQWRSLARSGRRGGGPCMHVNVSGTDICRPNFVAQVSAALLANGLEPGQLTLEITESTLTQRLDSARDAMAALRDIGVGLSVDDFGTGYSSLSNLSTLPIGSLKIDRSFVARLTDKGKDAEVVKAVITLGHALGKTVIAEGIETSSQLAQLRQMGCALGQGYLLARPLRAEIASAIAQADDSLGARLPVVDAPAPDNCMIPTGWSLTLH